MGLFVRRLFASAALPTILLVLAGLPAAAQAQTSDAQLHPAPDPNGVDLTTGVYKVSDEVLSIGQRGNGMSWAFPGDMASKGSFLWRFKPDANGYTVEHGDFAESFSLKDGVFTSLEGTGSTMVLSNGVYTYTDANGVVARFQDTAGTSTFAPFSKILDERRPDGEVLTYTSTNDAWPPPPDGGLPPTFSVTSNLGYQIKFVYDMKVTDSAYSAGFRWVLNTVTAINNAYDYCSPGAGACSNFTVTWPAVKNVNGQYAFLSDNLGRVTQYNPGATWRPSGAGVVHGAGYIDYGVGRWTYALGSSADSNIMTVTDPVSHTRVVTSNKSTGLITADTDGLGHTTSYAYDDKQRLTQVTFPEGDAIQYAYDARGNIVQTTQVAKPGSGLPNLVTTAGFDSNCQNQLTCNKPNYTVDASGAQTDYTYDPAHGGMLTVTGPAPVEGGVRPQTRYTYSQLYAWYKNSAGVLAQAPSPVWRVTGISTCVTTASCAGTADEIKTTIGYGSPGTPNNLLPTVVTVGSGDGTLQATTTYAYDPVGNLITVDGPLSGAADTVVYHYDSARQVIGTVGPDPDGSGPMKNPAQRITYDLDGHASTAETGLVDGPSDAAWSSFAAAQTTTTTYDIAGRPTKVTKVSGGAVIGLTQYTYDAANRLVCSAVRMNPAAFAALPTSACVASPPGADGPDPITALTYDAANQQTKVTVGYGAPSQRDVITRTFTPNGQVATVADGEGRLTTFGHDGLDRAAQIFYPLPANGAVSSTTDFEQYTYDAASRLATDRRRDGQVITFAYDRLGRPTKAANGATLTYDNLGRVRSAVLGGVTNTSTYDALGRLTAETSDLGAIAYQYDLAGRLQRLTWPDNFYVTYDSDAAGSLVAVRERGATSGSGVLATYVRDNFGRATQVARGDGVNTVYGYDNGQRLTTISHDLAGDANDETLGFTYDLSGRIRTRVSSNMNYNWTSGVSGSRAYGVNGLNQLTSSGGGALGYDARGNLTSDSGVEFGYDVNNNLVSVNNGANLKYDALGRLLSISAPSGAATVATRFVYAGNALVAEYDASGNLLRRYVPGAGIDQSLVWYEGAGTGDRRWLLDDERGSVISLVNAAGASIATNTYDDYGAPAAGNLGRFQFTGQAWIGEAGVYHFKARAYSPTHGRFMQTDPLGYADGPNWYAYAHNDPINLSDPSGTLSTWPTRETISSGAATLVAELIVTAKKLSAWGPRPPIFTPRPAASAGGHAPPSQDDANVVDEIVVVAPKKKKRDIPACPGGPYVTASYGVSGTLAFLIGGNASGSVVISHPLVFDWRNPLLGYQIGGNAQAAAMTGYGMFAGVGEQVGGGIAHGPMTPGASTGNFYYAEADAGAGEAIGGSVQVSANQSGRPTGDVSGGVGGKLGVGVGLYVGGGGGGNLTVASNPFGCR